MSDSFIYNLCAKYNPTRSMNNAADIFCNNFRDMVDANTIDGDKYFHSLANCQAGQKGYVLGALGLDYGREGLDYVLKNRLKGMSEQKNKADCIEDMRANLWGLKFGLDYPFTNCTDMMRLFRPPGLNKKY